MPHVSTSTADYVFFFFSSRRRHTRLQGDWIQTCALPIYGRSFVRRSSDRYDVIQASLVDTWAATAAGAYTLTENSLYTVEAFNDYLDHLTDDGILTVTRWVADGLRLVSLAQAACEPRGWSAADRLAIVRQGRVAAFLLQKSPFTAAEIAQLR